MSFQSSNKELMYRYKDIGNTVNNLKNAIMNDNLKATKAYLSKLKSVNNIWLSAWSRNTATFSAYAYAKSNNISKVSVSLLNSLLKKDFTFDGIPLTMLMTELSNEDFQIINDDYLNHPDSKWSFSEVSAIKLSFKKYPDLAVSWILNHRLNKFEKGKNRIKIVNTILSFGSSEVALIALNTFFNSHYILKYGIYDTKMSELLTILKSRPMDIQKYLLDNFFYDIAIRSLKLHHIVDHFEKNLITAEQIKKVATTRFNLDLDNFLLELENIENIDLRNEIIISCPEITDYISKNKSHLLPKEYLTLFSF